MKYTTGNILNVTQGVICQQVNAQYVMGAGLALAIAQKWPVVKQAYQKQRPALGTCQTIKVASGLFVANLVGQSTYGRTGTHTLYPALATAMAELASKVQDTEYQVYIPYKMGCGLAGGEWSAVQAIIETHIPSAIIMRMSDVREE